MKSVVLMLPLLVGLGCGNRGTRTPAEAHTRLQAAIAAHDAGLLWKALDEDTRWSWMSVVRAWRECYDITQSVVPEGPERARLLARFEPAATAENAQTLFTKMLTADEWRRMEELVRAAGSRLPMAVTDQATSELATAAGTLVYRKSRSLTGGWGFSGLAARAETEKRTAGADLERMRSDAVDYERAATRGAR